MDWDEDGGLDLLVGDEHGYVNLFRNSTVGVDNPCFDLVNQPTEYARLQNYPNPFNQSTKIKFVVLNNGPVRLSIYNSCGQLITVLIDDFYGAGIHEVTWESGNAASGTYFTSLYAGKEKKWIKMLVVK